MTEDSRYKDEFNKTGHSYGYFVSKPSLKKGTKADLPGTGNNSMFFAGLALSLGVAAIAASRFLGRKREE